MIEDLLDLVLRPPKVGESLDGSQDGSSQQESGVRADEEAGPGRSSNTRAHTQTHTANKAVVFLLSDERQRAKRHPSAITAKSQHAP